MKDSINRKNQSKYKIGQAVEVIIKTESGDFKFENKVECLISGIRASGTSEKDTYEYGLTTDMPGCYHSGKQPFIFMREDEILLINP